MKTYTYLKYQIIHIEPNTEISICKDNINRYYINSSNSNWKIIFNMTFLNVTNFGGSTTYVNDDFETKFFGENGAEIKPSKTQPANYYFNGQNISSIIITQNQTNTTIKTP